MCGSWGRCWDPRSTSSTNEAEIWLHYYPTLHWLHFSLHGAAYEPLSLGTLQHLWSVAFTVTHTLVWLIMSSYWLAEALRCCNVNMYSRQVISKTPDNVHVSSSLKFIKKKKSCTMTHSDLSAIWGMSDFVIELFLLRSSWPELKSPMFMNVTQWRVTAWSKLHHWLIHSSVHSSLIPLYTHYHMN